MKFRKHLIGATVAAGLGFTVASPASAMGMVNVTTDVTEQNEIIGGSVECPKGPWGDGFSANIGRVVDLLPAPQAQAFLDALSDFVGQYGASEGSRRTASGPVSDLGSEICSSAAP